MHTWWCMSYDHGVLTLRPDTILHVYACILFSFLITVSIRLSRTNTSHTHRQCDTYNASYPTKSCHFQFDNEIDFVEQVLIVLTIWSQCIDKISLQLRGLKCFLINWQAVWFGTRHGFWEKKNKTFEKKIIPQLSDSLHNINYNWVSTELTVLV